MALEDWGDTYFCEGMANVLLVLVGDDAGGSADVSDVFDDHVDQVGEVAVDGLGRGQRTRFL